MASPASKKTCPNLLGSAFDVRGAVGRRNLVQTGDECGAEEVEVVDAVGSLTWTAYQAFRKTGVILVQRHPVRVEELDLRRVVDLGSQTQAAVGGPEAPIGFAAAPTSAQMAAASVTAAM